LTIAFAFVFFLLSIGAGHVSAQVPPPAPDAAATAPAGPPPDAAAAPAPAGPGEPGTAQVENPYGLGALVENGDFVSHGVLGILALMSLGTWYIFVTKYWEQARLMGQAKVTEKKFWTAANLEDGIDKLAKNNVFRNV